MKLGQTSVVSFFSRIGVSVIGFVATVYLAQELGSEVLGTYFLTLSLLFWVLTFTDFGISSAMRKRLSEPDAGPGLVSAGVVLLTAVFVVIAALILFGGRYVDGFVGADVTLWLVVLLAARVGQRVVSAVLDGQKKVHLASLLDPLDRTVQSVVQIALVFVGVGLVGLYAGYLVGTVVAVLVGLYLMRANVRRPTRADFRSLYTYGRYAWLAAIKSRAYFSLDTLVLGYFLASNSLVGVYEIAWNVSVIFVIFSESIRRAVFPEVSSLEAEETERVRELTSAVIAYAGLLLIPGLVGAALVGDVVLGIYGDEFVQGWPVLVVLVVAQLLYAYGEQFTSVLGAMDYPAVIFRVNGAFLVVNLVLNVTLVPTIGWIGAAIGTAASALVGLVLGYWALRKRLDFSIPWGEISRQVVAAGVMAAVVVLGQSVVGSSTRAVLVLVGVGALVYVTSLTAISRQFRKTVLNNLPVDLSPRF